MNKFKDEYDIALKKLMQRKTKGNAIEEPPAPEKADHVIHLMQALKHSLKHGGKASR